MAFCFLSLILVLSAHARAQDIGEEKAAAEPPDYAKAIAYLQTGDTTAAIEQLRLATKSDRGFGPAFLRLGSLLSARSSELDEDWRLRKEAEEALREAWRILGPEPEVLLEYGLLLRKQLRRVDAERVLNRAWSEAAKRDRELEPEQRARFHNQLGRIYETWWEDFQDLVMIPPDARPIDCASLMKAQTPGDEQTSVPHWDAAVLCPRQWADQSYDLVPLADLRSEERERMIEHFRMAVNADSSHLDAAVRLLGHLADVDDWQEYMRIAGTLVRTAPADPRPYLFLALAFHESGLDQAADTLFAQTLALMPADEREVFNDVSPLLKKPERAQYLTLDSVARTDASRLFFAAADPLFLTEVEERRLEHYARLAWAELKFSDPAAGRRGWESERGQIWVRYGRPWKSYQCCYGRIQGRSGRTTGGRRVYWSYGYSGPVFVFRKLLGYRDARLTDFAKRSADDLWAVSPESYSALTVSAVYRVPHQVARFRGDESDLTSVEIYAAAPLDSLNADAGGSLDAGLFVFDDGYRPLWQQRHSIEISDAPLGLAYTVNLAPGDYRYGLEARVSAAEDAARPMARSRETLTIPGYPEDQLSISDLLLAESIRPLEPTVTRRDQLQIRPSRTLRFGRGAPISLYFEVYGLAADDEGFARYQVEFAVEDAAKRNLVERIVRGVAELFSRGAAPEPRVAWERTVRLSGDRAVDYVTAEIPARSAGEYVIRLRITDLGTGETVESEREVVISSRR